MFKIDRVTNKNFVEVFNKLDSAAKFKIQLPDFFFDVEYYYDAMQKPVLLRRKNKTLFQKSHLVCTKADLITVKGKFEKLDIVQQCTQERQHC